MRGISEPGPVVQRVPLGAALPSTERGQFGVVLTLSRTPTDLPERDRIAPWIADQRCGASIHWAPDGTLWDDAVDWTDIDGWSQTAEHTTLTS